MLVIQNLHSHYGTSHILHGVDLVVGAGEVVGLFGRNGAGKTTLLRNVAGWVRPSRGAISLEGAAIHGQAPESICRQGVAFVPEDRRIFPGLTVDENMQLALMQRPGTKRDAIDRIYDRFPRLAQRRRQAATTLSGGEQQMLAMARAIVCRPRLLLVDEPTEGLAPLIVQEIFALLRELRQAGTAILLVEQNLAGALDLCDRYYVIERGRVVAAGDANTAADRETLFATIAV